MDRLTYKLTPHMTEDGMTTHVYSDYPTRQIINKLAEYEDAEEQGLLFRFSVKVGDCFYLASKFYERVERAEVIELHIGKFAKGFSIHNQRIGIIKLSINEIGKHLFLTEEEAEAALKKMQEEQNNDE